MSCRRTYILNNLLGNLYWEILTFRNEKYISQERNFHLISLQRNICMKSRVNFAIGKYRYEFKSKSNQLFQNKLFCKLFLTVGISKFTIISIFSLNPSPLDPNPGNMIDPNPWFILLKIKQSRLWHYISTKTFQIFFLTLNFCLHINPSHYT